MINVSNNGSAIIVKATEGEYIYPSAKTELELPLNSVILTLDDSEMAVFRSASNFDVLFTAVIDNLQIDGASVTKDNIADKFADAATSEQGGFKYQVVDELPSEGEKGTIYLVPNEEGTHTEYLYVENVGWEQVGTAEVDLSDYYTKEEVDEKVDGIDLSDYYTKEEVDEGNRVNAAAFNVLQKSIGLNENLETLSGKSIQAQIDEVKESVPTQFKTINNESIVGEGNIEVEVEQNYVIAESDSEIPTDPKNGTLVYLNGQVNVIREWSSNEGVDYTVLDFYETLPNEALLIDVKNTPRYGGRLKFGFYDFETSAQYMNILVINSQQVYLSDEEVSLFDVNTNEFKNLPYTVNLNGGQFYFNTRKYNGVDMLAITWKGDNNNYRAGIYVDIEFDTPSGGMYAIEQTPSVMAQYENGDWKPFPQGGGSDNAYEKVEGINFIAATEEMPPIIEDQGSLLVGASLEQMMEGGVDTVALVSDGVQIQNSNGNNVFLGSESIYVNDEMEIKYSDILTKDDFIKTPNLTLFGAVNVNEGQISGFNAQNYAQFPFLVNLNTPFEINITVTLDGDVTNQHNIIDSDKGLAIAVRNGHFVVAMSSDGQTWNMGEHIGNINLNANQTYRLRLSWNRTSYKLAVNPYDTTEVNYFTDFEFNSSTSLFPTQIIVGKAVNNSNYFNGSINLNECSLSINGNKVWEGMDDLGLSTRLATDLSNIDAKGESVINDMIDSKIGEINTLLENLIG